MAKRSGDDQELPKWVQIVVLALATIVPLGLAVWLVSRFGG